MSTSQEPVHGVAIAKRTGERRLLRQDEYLVLDRGSEARWEFFSVPTDPTTGAPDASRIRAFGFTPGGPTVIPGDLTEVERGVFRRNET